MTKQRAHRPCHAANRNAAVGAGLLAIAGLSGCDRPDATPVGDDMTSGVAVSYNGQVASILYEHCVICHRPDASGPFSLLTYDDARRRARQIVTVTASRFMPPWLPASGHGSFANERRLSDTQIDALRRWADLDAPEGDPAIAIETPRFASGWQLGTPDLIVTPAEPYELRADGPDDFRNFVIAVDVPAMRYVRAVEFRPGNPRVVHHAVIYVDRGGSARRVDESDPGPGFGGMDLAEAETPDGHFLGWTPGRMPDPGTDGIAWRLHPGMDLVVQLHLQPSGKPETIRPRIGLFFTDTPPRRELFHVSLRNDFIDIPPGVTGYTIEDTYVLPVDVEVLSLYPHAHYLGKDLRVFATLPDGGRRDLIWIPDWDFNWQDQFRLADPLPLPRGTTLTMRYGYDNSADNPRNPFDPPREIRYGLQSTDEMGTLGIQVMPRRPGDLPILAEDMRRKGLQREIELYERLLSRVDDNPMAHHALGVAYRKLGRVEEATASFRRCLELDESFADGHVGLGVCLQLAGRDAEAVRHFQRALQIDPEHPDARYDLANSLITLDRYHEAILQLRTVVAARPFHASAQYNLGVALRRIEDLDGAMTHYRHAVAIRPDHAKAHYNLALLLGQAGRLDEATTHFVQAVEIDPGFADAHFRLAYTLELSGQNAGAARHYRETLRLQPGNAGARRGLARVTGGDGGSGS